MTETDFSLYHTYLAEIIRTLKSTNQYEQVLHLIVDRIHRLLKCQTCAIVLIDEKTEYLRIDNFHGLSQTFCNHFHRSLATRAIGRLLWTGETLLIRNAAANPESSIEVQLEHPFGSCLCLQIAVDNRTLGYLHIDTKEPDSIDEHLASQLQPLADMAGLAIVKARLFDENLHLERIDRETGLEKYGPFLEKVGESMERARHLQERFAIAILDIDNFKSIVNTFGYDTSRVLLKQFGSLIKDRLRPLDAGARYGFDEAILLFPNTDLHEALDHANAIRLTIAEAPLTDHRLTTTVSVGVASYPESGTETEDIILSAKKALFEAQRKGRNTVFCFSGEWSEQQLEHS